MKNIGMFYEDENDCVNAYRQHSQSANNLASLYATVTVKPKERTITIDGIRWMYYTFKDRKDVVKISGINFDAIFCEIREPSIKSFIMTRFRPGLER